MLDVGRAYARIFGPSEYLDDPVYTSYTSELWEAAKPRIGFDKVSTLKPPYALGGKIFTETRTEATSRASPVAPKVCTEPDQQPYSDASVFGKIALGPPIYCYSSSKRKWYGSNKKAGSEASYTLAFRGLSIAVLTLTSLMFLICLVFLDFLFSIAVQLV
jgi:hypothetical protein